LGLSKQKEAKKLTKYYLDGDQCYKEKETRYVTGTDRGQGQCSQRGQERLPCPTEEGRSCKVGRVA
jgi:hypothetical protein